MNTSTAQRWLWITPSITDHRSTGALVYSLSLADAIAEQGVEVTCVGLGAPTSSPIGPGLTPDIVAASPRPKWRGIISRHPNQTSATRVPAFHDRLVELLRETWDAVVVDGLQVGWVVSNLIADNARCVVYVAHNHETSMRIQIARSTNWRSLRRPLLEFDAIKTRRLEDAVLRRSDVISSISGEDLARFEQQAPDAIHAVVPPGWFAPPDYEEPVDLTQRPRRVGILGSFEWHAKQEGLRRFLAEADPAFARAEIELVIAGNVPEDFRRTLGDLHATTFLGWVESPTAVLASCRVGAIAEPLGGGFKLKALDYVFSNVAVATLSHSAAGLPFTAGTSMIVADDEPHLVAAIVDAVDDPDRLRQVAAEARRIADGAFSWSVGARRLIDAVGDVERLEPGI